MAGKSLMSYAESTSVPVDRSQAEIKKTLTKYGASGFVFGEKPEVALVIFEMKERKLKFLLPLPTLQAATASHYQKKGLFYTQTKLDQELRRRWRCLLLAIKSKLECVESGISTFEEEFMAHIVLPNGATVGQWATPQIESAYRTGNMPPLLGYDG
jgi:hypothetical protein